MEVLLVSADAELQRICRELLGEILGSGWGLRTGEAIQRPVSSDLCIWDLQPDLCLPDWLTPNDWRRHLFLVHRKHLPLLRDKGYPEVNIILKPITRATLRTFLEQACHRLQDAENADVNAQIQSLRADRDELLQCLIQANLKLQEYDQERTNFLARAIHDFRAPLTALSGYCGLLLGEQLGALTRDQKEVIQRMQHSAKRLARMANAMFQLSIWQRVDQKPVLQKHDIRECIEQALHELLPFTEEKRIQVNLHIVPPPETLAFEKSQLEQVLINLLDNACKFTPRGGTIDIRGYPYFWERRRSITLGQAAERRVVEVRSPNSFRVDIRDSGPGIPPSHLESIFEEYTSYAGGHDRSGGGLGLAICKMILSRHQGRVWAENSPTGAVFSFVLPFHRADHLPGEGGGSESVYYIGAA